ncbi:PepSY domain-containing protein [Alteromonas halophila]|uniref:PepSY domain-containing protein n=1 Tax=Alteromonas halophila TaxID=516698 RepID=A0A918JD80_9ALTE|nr:PepSY domain-containing protein [Alteromonas halophila]GGW75341.1 hypothetical protein GCM10007391_04510 [Alteromonas halophila]
MKHSKNALLLCLMLLAVPVATPLAQQQNDSAVESKSQAAEKARQAVKGRVLRVVQTRNTYRVKVLKKSGRVVSVDVDKRSGQVKAGQPQDDKG